MALLCQGSSQPERLTEGLTGLYNIYKELRNVCWVVLFCFPARTNAPCL